MIFLSFGWRKFAAIIDTGYGADLVEWLVGAVAAADMTDVLAGKAVAEMKEATARYASNLLQEVVVQRVHGVMMIAYTPSVRSFFLSGA